MTPDVTTLLVVDDDEMNRDMLGRRLQRAGYQIVVAENGTEALAAVDRESVDLVLLDIMMPDMSGIEVLKRLRTTHTPESLPVIMVTAKTQSEDVVEALELGANDYVTKPIDLAVVLARIRAQIARRDVGRALSESKERYARAVLGAKDGLWDWKVGTEEVFYSPRWKTIMGYDADQSVEGSAGWFDRVHPDDLQRVKAELDAHLQGQSEHFESEHRIRIADGHYRWVLARGLAVRGGDGRAERIAGSVTDITEGKVADALTGLPNRVLFNDRLGRLIEYRRRVPEFQFAVLFLDLDRFKNVNDSLGHQAGDRLLVQVARRLEVSTRSTDTVARVENPDPGRSRVTGNTLARFGGDEFGVILSGIHHATDATRVADRISRILTERFVIDDRDVFITASIGIALSASGYERAEEMLRDADTAMYRAKAGGRARYDIFDTEMREQVIRRLQVETDLRHAIDRGEFTLYYQPIISLSDGVVTSLEALVRWNHPQRGLVGPDEFIPVAEETGLIVPIGFWVLREVCRQLREWAAADPQAPPIVVGVNVSARQLLLPDLAERLVGIIAEYGIDASRIELEITESAMMTDPEVARTTAVQLNAHGFRLSIDDFGTGYSSLSYLQRFPVDRLKIDRSFLAEAATNGNGVGIILTIVRLAEHMKLEVVAEGIETISQLEQVQSLKCGFGQGYYFLRPGPPDSLNRLLMRDELMRASEETDPATARDKASGPA